MNLAGEKKTYEPLALLSTLMLMSFLQYFNCRLSTGVFFPQFSMILFSDSFTCPLAPVWSPNFRHMSQHYIIQHAQFEIDWLSNSFSGLPISCHTPSHIPQIFLALGGTYISGIINLFSNSVQPTESTSVEFLFHQPYSTPCQSLQLKEALKAYWVNAVSLRL